MKFEMTEIGNCVHVCLCSCTVFANMITNENEEI